MTPADAGALTATEFDALFDSFGRTVVRLEALRYYAVGGAEELRLRAWRSGRPRPERSIRTDAWLARIAVSTIRDGKVWSRVRVVDDPLTDYQRYQLESYREAQTVGDRVTIARRPDVGDVGPDVWLFDVGTSAEHAVLMHYHSDGRIDRRELVTAAAQLSGLAAGVADIAAQAVPLNEFLAAADG